jgi:ubiquinone/menaquinone biosynthesis C-methylase UbiE
MAHSLYQILHRLATPREERDSNAAPGYWQYKVRAAALNMLDKTENRVLEVGCGDGLFLKQLFLLNPQARIWAIDIEPDNIRKAQERLGRELSSKVVFEVQDALNLTFEDNYFQEVVCLNVLMALDSVPAGEKVLASMARVCAKGGNIIFEFRNSQNPLLRLKYKLAPYYDKTMVNRRLTMYEPGRIESFLRSINFEITEKKSLGFPVPALAPVIIIKARKI